MLMNDLALAPEMTGEVALYDVDRPMAMLNARWGRRVNKSPQCVSRWRYTVPKTLQAALAGADFVVASIQPGSIDMMKHDLEIPKRYGILHPVGDTVGPAGLCRCLRTVPMYARIAEAVERCAPNAWVISYTNPMTVCTRTLYRVWPRIKAFGCCHEVFSTQRWLAGLMKEFHGCEPTRDEVRVNVLGVNHFTWIDKATCKGVDLMQLARRKMRRKGEVRPVTDAEVRQLGFFQSKSQVKYDLLRRFGILPAAGERHLVEFVPFYLKDEQTLHRWGVVLTPYSYRETRYANLPRQFRKRLRDRRRFELKKSGEEGTRQMAAILGLHDLRTNVNLPNIGQIDGLPRGAVVETNAYFSRDSVKPEFAGRLPPGVEALVSRVVAGQEMIVEAGLTCDKELAFQAFLNDPLMSLTTDKAWKLFNEMLRATRAFLPKRWKL
ncbi:MAG: alpha-glucosidase/alpha-galactosidase [Kiritimatiellae bacterium]|nr:alpha-glucosidase/alpha-galactosidase [Kiritimatiellia bacterium]